MERAWARYAIAALSLLELAACDAAGDQSASQSRAALTAKDGSTGVPDCDSYLDQYERCMQARLAPPVFTQHLRGIQRQRSAWTDLADTPFKKQSLARVCRAAIGTAREEFPGCTWSG